MASCVLARGSYNCLQKLASLTHLALSVFTARRYAYSAVFAVARCPSVRHVGGLSPDG